MVAEPIETKFQEALHLYNSAQSASDYECALDKFSALLDDTPDMPDDFRFSAQFLCAECKNKLGRPREAETLLRDLLQHPKSRTPDRSSTLAAANVTLAEILSATNNWQEAIDLFSNAAAYFRQEQEWYSEANIQRNIALIWQEHNDLGQALVALNNALSILEPHESTNLHLDVLFACGHCHYLAEDFKKKAIELEERALIVARHLGDDTADEKLISNLSTISFDVHDYRRAIHYNSMMLEKARRDGIVKDIVRHLSILGMCFTEMGRPQKAIGLYDEVQGLLSTCTWDSNVVAGMCMLGRAEALVDMKRYDEASPMLTEARKLLASDAAKTDLIDRIKQRLDRETRTPLILDCAHRALQMILAGSSHADSLHRNPQPEIDLEGTGYFIPNLTQRDRDYFSTLTEEVGSDQYRLRYSKSSDRTAPAAFQMGVKFEYVDDVEVFELKWQLYKTELEYARRSASLQGNWERLRGKFKHVEGVFQGDLIQLLEYVSQLSEISDLCSELGNRKLFSAVAMHAADFLEMQTNDPMVAALLWPNRGKLFLAADRLAESHHSELIKIELRRCLDQVQKLFGLLDNKRRIFALEHNVETWFFAANKILGQAGYSALVALVGDLQRSLSPSDQIRHGLAIGEASNPTEGVRLVDTILSTLRMENPNVPIILAPEFESGLARLRFQLLAPDLKACNEQYGPFAPYIRGEVFTRAGERYPSQEQDAQEPRPPVLAFASDNLVVIASQLEGTDYISAMMHELEHSLRRAGQRLLTEAGDWLLVKRDVPIASALTYLHILQSQSSNLKLVASKFTGLVSKGRRLVRDDPDKSRLHIVNMLRYFDDLGTQETAASYPCAALLLGMAFGYHEDSGAVESYLRHLAVVDHDEAIVLGRRKATLRL